MHAFCAYCRSCQDSNQSHTHIETNVVCCSGPKLSRKLSRKLSGQPTEGSWALSVDDLSKSPSAKLWPLLKLLLHQSVQWEGSLPSDLGHLNGMPGSPSTQRNSTRSEVSNEHCNQQESMEWVGSLRCEK